jgi:hypothetical protein
VRGVGIVSVVVGQEGQLGGRCYGVFGGLVGHGATRFLSIWQDALGEDPCKAERAAAANG